jgi:hypothetical protein
MNKKLFLVSFFLYFSLSISNLFGQCYPHRMASRCKDTMNVYDYDYDSYNYNEINFVVDPQTIQIAFTARAGFRYILIFTNSGFDENVNISIYDKGIKAAGKRTIYNNAVDKNTWVTINKPGTYYIYYQIPPKGGSKWDNGCVMMLVGFRNISTVTREQIH